MLASRIDRVLLGSIFLLAIMAVAKERARVRDGEITEDIWLRFNYILRCPVPGVFLSVD